MSDQFYSKCNNHINTMDELKNFLSAEAMVDVTLACEESSLKAHKIVLSSFSPFFKSLFLENPCKHPIVMLKNIKFNELSPIINFMYCGEINVPKPQLSAVVKTAQILRVKGFEEMESQNSQSSKESKNRNIDELPKTFYSIKPLNQTYDTQKQLVDNQNNNRDSNSEPEISYESSVMNCSISCQHASIMSSESHSINSFSKSEQELPVEQSCDEKFVSKGNRRNFLEGNLSNDNMMWNCVDIINDFKNFLSNKDMVDVTLACDGQSLKAHKIVLSACSPFFKSLFLDNPCNHPVVILNDMKYADLKVVIEFMYNGEINVAKEQLLAVLKIAQILKVRGLGKEESQNSQSDNRFINQPGDELPHKQVYSTEHSHLSCNTQTSLLSDQNKNRGSDPEVSQKKLSYDINCDPSKESLQSYFKNPFSKSELEHDITERVCEKSFTLQKNSDNTTTNVIDTIKWNKYLSLMNEFKNLLLTGTLADVTLACQGLSLKVHKVVLSASSPFFKSLFLDNPCTHPVVILKNMRFADLKAIIEFMYYGEINITKDQLSAVIKIAQTLKVEGLEEFDFQNNQFDDQYKDLLDNVPENPCNNESKDICNNGSENPCNNEFKTLCKDGSENLNYESDNTGKYECKNPCKKVSKNKYNDETLNIYNDESEDTHTGASKILSINEHETHSNELKNPSDDELSHQSLCSVDASKLTFMQRQFMKSDNETCLLEVKQEVLSDPEDTIPYSNASTLPIQSNIVNPFCEFQTSQSSEKSKNQSDDKSSHQSSCSVGVSKFPFTQKEFTTSDNEAYLLEIKQEVLSDPEDSVPYSSISTSLSQSHSINPFRDSQKSQSDEKLENQSDKLSCQPACSIDVSNWTLVQKESIKNNRINGLEMKQEVLSDDSVPCSNILTPLQSHVTNSCQNSQSSHESSKEFPHKSVYSTELSKRWKMGSQDSQLPDQSKILSDDEETLSCDEFEYILSDESYDEMSHQQTCIINVSNWTLMQKESVKDNGVYISEIKQEVLSDDSIPYSDLSITPLHSHTINSFCESRNSHSDGESGNHSSCEFPHKSIYSTELKNQTFKCKQSMYNQNNCKVSLPVIKQEVLSDDSIPYSELSITPLHSHTINSFCESQNSHSDGESGNHSSGEFPHKSIYSTELKNQTFKCKQSMYNQNNSKVSLPVIKQKILSDDSITYSSVSAVLLQSHNAKFLEPDNHLVGKCDKCFSLQKIFHSYSKVLPQETLKTDCLPEQSNVKLLQTFKEEKRLIVLVERLDISPDFLISDDKKLTSSSTSHHKNLQKKKKKKIREKSAQPPLHVQEHEIIDKSDLESRKSLSKTKRKKKKTKRKPKPFKCPIVKCSFKSEKQECVKKHMRAKHTKRILKVRLKLPKT